MRLNTPLSKESLPKISNASLQKETKNANEQIYYTLTYNRALDTFIIQDCILLNSSREPRIFIIFVEKVKYILIIKYSDALTIYR